MKNWRFFKNNFVWGLLIVLLGCCPASDEAVLEVNDGQEVKLFVESTNGDTTKLKISLADTYLQCPDCPETTRDTAGSMIIVVIEDSAYVSCPY